MNKKILTVILLAIVLFLPVAAYAIANNIQSLGAAIANVAWVVFGVIVIVCFIIAGVLFLAAQGDPVKIAKARSALLWGIAGVVVGIVAFSIIKIISGVL